MSVPYKPKGYHTITPYLTVGDVPAIMEFIAKVFDGTVSERLNNPDGSPRHVEMTIGDSVVMIGSAESGANTQGSMLYTYVEDTDATYEKALAAGGTTMMEPSDQFYGDRSAGIMGPGGVAWWISTHVEDLTSEEMQQRMNEMREQS